MSINQAIVQTKSDIIKVVNESKLPIAVLDLILAEIRSTVSNQLGLQLMKEQETSEEEKTEVE